METLEKIDQLLKCAICLQRYDNPKITTCFHTFCDSCINKQFTSKNTFICPVCSAETQQPATFIENSLINTIVHILTEKDGGRRNCDLCDEEAADPAVGRCNDCSKLLCEHHVLNHKKTKDTKTHVVTPLVEPTPLATTPYLAIAIPNPRELRMRTQRQVKREHVEDDESDEREEPVPERPPLKEGPSYSEMIIQALRSLGGRGTSAQIAEYISENYAEVLKYKTKTWRNSVMGCLSVKSHLFSKEPMEGRPDKYIWVLREGVTNGSGGSRQVKRPAPKKPRVKPSSTTITASKSEEMQPEIVEEDEQALAGLMALDFDSLAPKTPPPTEEEKERVDVDLITEVLLGLGGSGTTDQITESIISNYKETFPNYSRRKLSYTINAILSAPKYRDRFTKDKIEGHSNSIWKLAKAENHSSSPENAETYEKTEITSS